MGNNSKALKRRVRERMEKTGERYTTALSALRRERAEKVDEPSHQGATQGVDGEPGACASGGIRR